MSTAEQPQVQQLGDVRLQKWEEMLAAQKSLEKEGPTEGAKLSLEARKKFIIDWAEELAKKIVTDNREGRFDEEAVKNFVDFLGKTNESGAAALGDEIRQANKAIDTLNGALMDVWFKDKESENGKAAKKQYDRVEEIYKQVM